jgi:hypothetical protein
MDVVLFVDLSTLMYIYIGCWVMPFKAGAESCGALEKYMGWVEQGTMGLGRPTHLRLSQDPHYVSVGHPGDVVWANWGRQHTIGTPHMAVTRWCHCAHPPPCKFNLQPDAPVLVALPTRHVQGTSPHIYI